MRRAYEQYAGLRDLLRRAGELSAKTVILDVEPLVAAWDSGQEALEKGVADVAGEAAAIPGVRVVCFATNAARRPSGVLPAPAAQVTYLAKAGKPLRTGPYRDLPRPGVVIGDQLATDGALAWRLGYTFLQYRCPGLDRVPAGPRFMGYCGALVRPVLFTRPR
jgi:predicted HAD superfamily phosphohydrolase YqeG